ncbi:MAG: hypothetical protein DM484_16290 [Candidatus Methylumidiphilus alinenensis]|uniref:Uncharacterized protein n=1 Tax=Candidatus Methylumidiphilus alinenensis TaxID=2202197 RepID=A0A2W4SV11_9GAMM|nr:MAG: hypothetical protein DM484_16290 [Candidatus Methylumidiphilus alinenensis]
MIFGLGVWQIVDAKETIALAHDILTTSCLSQAFSATFNKTNALSEWLALLAVFYGLYMTRQTVPKCLVG